MSTPIEKNTEGLLEILQQVNELPEAGTSASNAVLFVEQTLTPEQQAQARQNIGVTGTGKDGESPIITLSDFSDYTRSGVCIEVKNPDGSCQIYHVYNGRDGYSGQPGNDGITPHIGANGNWFIGDTDTGMPSRGEDGKAEQTEPEVDDIPIIFYGKALPQTKDDTIMPFRYVSRTQDIKGYCVTKAQGTSSMSYPKKNQTTKIYADAECTEKLKIDFRGWGKQNKFCLKANWIDITHARNIVSARLWADVVKSRSDYAELPELLRTSPNQGAVDGFPVKVYAAGVYQGRYTLNIPKDGWMANMDDELDTHCILCGESKGAGHFRAEALIDESDWSDELHDTVPAAIKTRWNEVISFVMNSTDAVFKSDLGNYFDVPSVMDYYLFGLASCHFDGFAKNQIYMTYDGQKWIASAYDMDSTWGLHWNGQSFVAVEEQTYLGSAENLLYWRLSQLFKNELKERWVELRDDVLSEAHVLARFEEFMSVCPPYVVAEDYAETTGGGAFTGIPSATTNNIQQIRQYVVDRLAWSDRKMGIDNSEPVENYTNQIPISTDASGAVYNGVGYKKGYQMNQGNEQENRDVCVTGFIPCKAGDVIRMKNMPFNTTLANCKLSFFNSDKTYINQALSTSSWYMDTEFTGIKDEDGNYVCFTLKNVANFTDSMAYIRITALSITEDSIVTVNEPIE